MWLNINICINSQEAESNTAENIYQVEYDPLENVDGIWRYIYTEVERENVWLTNARNHQGIWNEYMLGLIGALLILYASAQS